VQAGHKAEDNGQRDVFFDNGPPATLNQLGFFGYTAPKRERAGLVAQPLSRPLIFIRDDIMADKTKMSEEKKTIIKVLKIIDEAYFQLPKETSCFESAKFHNCILRHRICRKFFGKNKFETCILCGATLSKDNMNPMQNEKDAFICMPCTENDIDLEEKTKKKKK
jgi:hypothetical protein